MNRSPEYIQKQPENYLGKQAFPKPSEIVDSLASIARAKWPPFISPILFPNSSTRPKSLSSIGAVDPITSSAHPAIKSLSCALLHPHDPSCVRTYVSYWVQAFPTIARFFTLFYSVMTLAANPKVFLDTPAVALNALAKRVLRMSVFITGLIGTSWASLCLMIHLLPRNFLPTQRFYLAGFISGLFAFLQRKGGRSNFLMVTRMSIDSLWKVGVKRGWWKGFKNGDLLIFVASLAAVQGIYEINPQAISGGVARKALSSLRGDGWVDRASASGVSSPAGSQGAQKQSPTGVQEVEEKDSSS